jgi:SAM-dependent methyltransferase
MSKHTKIHQKVSSYYTSKLEQHGDTHSGVDWNSTESQNLRFQQLMMIHQRSGAKSPFSINDYGCGYGALIDYLNSNDYTFTYCGFDIAESMIKSATQRYIDNANVQFLVSDADLAPADYTVASGIFNVRLDVSNSDWQAYILDTLQKMWGLSAVGIAFNCLTSYSDKEYMRDDLYYADPCFLFDYCKKHLSKQVALFHDYYLYEFTMLVLREDLV